MKVVFSTPNAGIYAHDNGDVATIVSVTASGTIAGLAAPIPIAGQRVIAICHSPDASNIAVTISMPEDSIYWRGTGVPLQIRFGTIVEVYTDNGPITVFPSAGGPFMDGSISKVVTSGQRFIYLPNSQWNAPAWAFLD